jgi:hypothetical protein
MRTLELCYKNLSLFKTSSLHVLTEIFLRVTGNGVPSCGDHPRDMQGALPLVGEGTP